MIPRVSKYCNCKNLRLFSLNIKFQDVVFSDWSLKRSIRPIILNLKKKLLICRFLFLERRRLKGESLETTGTLKNSGKQCVKFNSKLAVFVQSLQFFTDQKVYLYSYIMGPSKFKTYV